MLSFLEATSTQETFSNTKCAEVYCQTWEHFSIICTFCEMKTFEFDDFLQHFKNVHLENNEITPEITIKCEIEESSREFQESTEYHEQLQDIQQFAAASDEDFKAFDNTNWKEDIEHKGIASSSDSDGDNNDDEDYVPDTLLKVSTKHKCNECTKSYKLLKSLEHHIKICHNLNKSLKNTQFDNVLSGEQAISAHSRFFCDQCDKNYKNKKDLKMHAFIHTGERNFVCDVTDCAKAFVNPKYLNKHKRNVHKIRRNNVRNRRAENAQDTFEDKWDKLYLTKSKCSQKRKTQTEERGFKCTLCSFSFKRKGHLKDHMRRHADKKFNCEMCEKTFLKRTELTEHFRTHTGERPYICSYCDRTFPTSSSLGEHIKRHNNVRTHKCQFCERSFYNGSQLKRHMPVHTNERPFVCSTCSASFPRKCALAQHMKLHLNAREYVCNICRKSFNQKPAMLTHVRLFHKVVEPLEYRAVQRLTTHHKK